LKNADPGNAAVTDAMKNYTPPETMLVSSCGKFRQRLIFYGNDEREEDEVEMIKSFKKFCNDKKVRVPQIDCELVRYLYSMKKNN
jgi:hypothetical protein